MESTFISPQDSPADRVGPNPINNNPGTGMSENTSEFGPPPADPATEGPTPKYFLTLEFVADAQAYWLVTTIDGSRLREFARYPVSAFGGRPLNPGHLRWDDGNSELLLFSEDGKGARFSSIGEEDPEEIDVGAMERLTWNGMCAKALGDFHPDFWEGLYLNNVVRLAKDSKWGNPEVDYTVTAFLPEEGTVALWGEDHNPPENINWRGIQGLDTPEDLRAFLAELTVVAIALGDRLLRVD